MFINISAILIRIISSSFLNMFQKLLTKNNLSSSCVNFNSYFGLCLLTFPIFCLSFDKINYTNVLVYNVFLMGAFGALGNYFIIKALSLGQLSIVSSINAYKPIVALIVGFLYLHEVPNLFSLFGIFIIIISTFLLFKTTKTSFFRLDVFYRFLALIFSGTEAIFIKKIILLTNSEIALCFWVLSGLVFSFLLCLPTWKAQPLNKENLKLQIFLVISIFLMQYFTNIVFAHFTVSSALALFQLSNLFSIFLGGRFFSEQDIPKKAAIGVLMVIGAIIVIFSR